MGLQSVVKKVISQMEKTDTTNVHVLALWAKRVGTIAKDLGQSGDTPQQTSFESVVTAIAQRFIREAAEPDHIFSRLDPEALKRREKILLQGDEMLNVFESPSTAHPHAMQEAAREDATLLKKTWEEMDEMSDGILEEITESASIRKGGHYGLHKGHLTQPATKKLTARERIEQSLHWLEGEPIPEPSILVAVCEMLEYAGMDRYLISFEETFGDLIEKIINSDSSARLPDLWCKRYDSKKNHATDSGAWWECQSPGKRVAETIMEATRPLSSRSDTKIQKRREGLEIRSVVKSGEYLVALVGREGEENGLPVAIPQEDRQPAFLHFQGVVFPNETVSRVSMMDSGSDASHIMFDNRRFPHKTNPVYVEVRDNPGDVQQWKRKGRATLG